MIPVVRLQQLSLSLQVHGATYCAHMAPVAGPLGAKQIGARYVEVPPGKRAWPYHCHHGNDELFVILGGEGRLRFGGEEHAVAAGDVVVCPAGGPETAHQLIASGEEPLRYLAVSTIEPRLGPRELKLLTTSSLRSVGAFQLAEPTVMTDGSWPGEPTVP